MSVDIAGFIPAIGGLFAAAAGLAIIGLEKRRRKKANTALLQRVPPKP